MNIDKGSVFAKGFYWLFYDWASGSSGNSDIYVMKSSDAMMWSDLTPVVETPNFDETRPRAFFNGFLPTTK